MDGYRALLIGNSTFPADHQNLQELKGPVKDVTVLAAALTDREVGLFDGDYVTLLVERPAGRILEEIEAFFVDARRDDQLLLYYSGHGLLDERNQLYLAAANTRIDRLRSTAVSAADVSEMVDNSAARTAVILLDCCHSGGFKGTIGPAALAGSGRFVLTSCRSGELANDADRRNGTSMFTQHLVDGLMGGVADLDGDGRIDVDEVYRYVHECLAATNRQIPQRRFDGSARTPAVARRSLPAAGIPLLPSAPSEPGLSELPELSEPELPASPKPEVIAQVVTTPSRPAAAAARTGAAGTIMSWLHGGVRRRMVVAAAVVAGLVVAGVLVAMARRDSPNPVPPPSQGPAGLSDPQGIALLGDELFIVDRGNHRVVKVTGPERSVTVVAGNGTYGAMVEGQPAVDAWLDDPRIVVPLTRGGFVVVESNRLLSVRPDGTLRTVRVEGSLSPALSPINAAVADTDGRLYLASESTVLRLDLASDLASGVLSAVAGTETKGFSGDGDAALYAQLDSPHGLALDRDAKNLYIADSENRRVRRVDLVSRVITTMAGKPEGSYQDGARAADVSLWYLKAVAVGPDGGVYLFDTRNAVFEVLGERINIVAGQLPDAPGAHNNYEDGLAARETTFIDLRAVAVDGKGRIFLTEGNRIRLVLSNGLVMTYA